MSFDPAPTPSEETREWGEGGTPGTGAFASYGRALRSHPWLVALVFIVIFGAGVAWAIHKQPSYQATARLLVNPLPQTDTTFLGLPLLRDSGDPTTNMETAATLIDSPQAAQQTAQLLGRGWTQRRVQTAVNVQPEGASQIVDVIATASDPALAARIANTFTRTALSVRAAQLHTAVAADISAISSQLASIRAPGSPAAANLESELSALRPLAAGQDPTTSISQDAVPPNGSSGLSRPVTAAIALIAGIVIASALALLIEMLRSPRVLSEEQLLSLLPGAVVARIPVLPRRLRRRDGMLRRPLPPAVSEALRGTRIQLDLMRSERRTVLITSAFHGDGKTTTAVNLAREIAASGARVLVIDADLRKPDVGVSFGVAPRMDLPRALEAADALDVLREAPGAPGVYVLPARQDVGFETLDRVARSLDAFLDRIAGSVDYVILDAPPLGEVTDVLRFIGVADYILLVSRLGNTTVGALQVTRELLTRAGRRITGHMIIGATPRHVQHYGYGYGHGDRRTGEIIEDPLPPIDEALEAAHPLERQPGDSSSLRP